MAFRDTFHEVIPGYRVNGDVMVFAIMGVKEGGLCDGCKTLEIGNFGIGHRTLLQVPDEYTQAPAGYFQHHQTQPPAGYFGGQQDSHWRPTPY